MGKQPNYEVERAFKLTLHAYPPEVMTVRLSDTSQCWFEDKYACRSCGKELAKNAVRQAKHLRKCKLYLEQQTATGNSNSITRGVEEHAIARPEQTTLNKVIRKLIKAEKLHLDLKAVGGFGDDWVIIVCQDN